MLLTHLEINTQHYAFEHVNVCEWLYLKIVKCIPRASQKVLQDLCYSNSGALDQSTLPTFKKMQLYPAGGKDIPGDKIRDQVHQLSGWTLVSCISSKVDTWHGTRRCKPCTYGIVLRSGGDSLMLEWLFTWVQLGRGFHSFGVNKIEIDETNCLYI
jgi:hypothetical protein